MFSQKEQPVYVKSEPEIPLPEFLIGPGQNELLGMPGRGCEKQLKHMSACFDIQSKGKGIIRAFCPLTYDRVVFGRQRKSVRQTSFYPGRFRDQDLQQESH